jgi:hypothetical protein
LVAETLRDLVHTWNVFINGDPKGRELDEMRLGPQEAKAAKPVIAAAIPIIEAIEHSENVVTPLAVEAVAEQGEAAKNALPGINGDQAIDLSRKTTGNFVSELLRNAYASVRKEAGFAWKESRAGFLSCSWSKHIKCSRGQRYRSGDYLVCRQKCRHFESLRDRLLA